jgi:glycosyltransferase involved in cell wall biosynthesis
MHVLSFVDYLSNVGGAELSARTILTRLAGHEAVDRVTVVGVDLPDEERLSYPGVDVVPVSLPARADSLPDFLGDLLFDRRIAAAAREHLPDADVVHAHHRRSTMALQHLDVEAPTVGTVRDFWPVCPISVYFVDGEPCTGCEDRLDDCIAYQGWDGLGAPVVRRYLLAKRRHNRAAFGPDHAVFISEHLRNSVRETLSVSASTVIDNPVSVDCESVLDPPNRPTFVVASTLSKEKGVDTAVAAMGRVLEHLPDARLLVFGDGPLEEELRAQASEYHDGAVEFRGRVPADAVHDAMATATATVFPSRWNEPFGRVTVESLQVGTPVVGADVGGIAEVLADGETGRLVAPGDPAALAEAMVALARDRETWHAMAAAGVDAGERFRPERVVDRHVDLYRDLSA